MDVSFQALNSPKLLQAALKNLQPALKADTQWPGLAKKSVDALRRKMIDAKVKMIVPDLIIECLAFGCVGWITNLYSKIKTGKNQFTGELRAVSQDKLALLQSKDARYQQSEMLRSALTVAISLAIPYGFGILFKQALKVQPTKNTGKWISILKQHAAKFDYKNGIWMGLASLGLVCGVQLIGHVLAARNWREVQEQVVRESALDMLFFGGDTVWLKIIHLLVFKPLKVPQYKQIQDIIQRSPLRYKSRNAWLGTGAFLASFATNAVALSLFIKFLNQQTEARTRKASQTQIWNY